MILSVKGWRLKGMLWWRQEGPMEDVPVLLLPLSSSHISASSWAAQGSCGSGKPNENPEASMDLWNARVSLQPWAVPPLPSIPGLCLSLETSLRSHSESGQAFIPYKPPCSFQDHCKAKPVVLQWWWSGNFAMVIKHNPGCCGKGSSVGPAPGWG